MVVIRHIRLRRELTTDIRKDIDEAASQGRILGIRLSASREFQVLSVQDSVRFPCEVIYMDHNVIIIVIYSEMCKNLREHFLDKNRLATPYKLRVKINFDKTSTFINK